MRIARVHSNAMAMQTAAAPQVRRFEPAASGIIGTSTFLSELGYGICQYGNSFKVWYPGQRQFVRMKMSELMELLDRERERRGLTPIIKRDGWRHPTIKLPPLHSPTP